MYLYISVPLVCQLCIKIFNNTEKLGESSLMQLLAACCAHTGSLGFYCSHGRDVGLTDEPHVSLCAAQLLICQSSCICINLGSSMFVPSQ